MSGYLKNLAQIVTAVAAIIVLAIAFGHGAAPPNAAAATATPAPRVVGCTPKGKRYRENGWRGRRTVALTFDGGPTAQYTRQILAKLRAAKVHATFFIRGQFIHGRTAMLREEIAQGHELANHSFSHPHFPPTDDLRRTTRLIHQATGYTPCLFRAPYGSIDSALLGRARRLGMLTIGWDVDSWDSLYDNVSTSTVYSRVVNLARPGSIILMHDGEGSHQATLHALTPILRELKRRHLQPVTVSELLGLHQRTVR